MGEKYKIVGKFDSFGNKMVAVAVRGAVCVMTQNDFQKILVSERNSLKHSR